MNSEEQGRGRGSKIGNFERTYFLNAPLKKRLVAKKSILVYSFLLFTH